MRSGYMICGGIPMRFSVAYCKFVLASLSFSNCGTNDNGPV